MQHWRENIGANYTLSSVWVWVTSDHSIR